MAFTVLPAVHLERGRLPDYPRPSSADALTALARAHGEVYVIDSEGLQRNRPDLEFLREAARMRPLWVDAGSRYATDGMDALVAGARRITMRWNLLHGLKEAEEAADLAERGSIYLAIEIGQHGFVQNRTEPSLSPEGVARRARDLGFGLAVLAPRYDAELAGRVVGVTDESWWIGPATREDAVDLRQLRFNGLIAPAASMESFIGFETPRPDVPAEREGGA